jgi:hypothetical protein
MTRISFRVFRVFRGYIPGAVTRPVAAASLEILAGDFESMNLGLPNQITGTSRFAQSECQRHRRLAPIADLGRSLRIEYVFIESRY